MKKKLVATAVASLLAVTALSACSDTGSKSDSTQSETTKSETTQSESAQS